MFYDESANQSRREGPPMSVDGYMLGHPWTFLLLACALIAGAWLEWRAGR
jgi:hypothetical protein